MRRRRVARLDPAFSTGTDRKRALFTKEVPVAVEAGISGNVIAEDMESQTARETNMQVPARSVYVYLANSPPNEASQGLRETWLWCV